MSKQPMAILAITFIGASLLSAPFSTEAQKTGDVRTTPNQQYRSIATPLNYTRSVSPLRDTSAIRTTYRRANDDTRTTRSRDTSSAADTAPAHNAAEEAVATNPPAAETEVGDDEQVTEDTTPTQPDTTVTENEPVPTVTSDETEQDDSANVSSDDFMTKLADEIHRLTNVARERAGVATLGYDNALATVAEQHSTDMAQNDYFSHTAQDGCDLTCRFDEAGYDAWAWGENIAWRNSSQLPEATELAAYFVGQWMDSDGHRRNILSDSFTHEGVGLAQIGNKVYATVNFADPR